MRWAIVLREVECSEEEIVALRLELQAELEQRFGERVCTVTLRQDTFDHFTASVPAELLKPPTNGRPSAPKRKISAIQRGHR